LGPRPARASEGRSNRSAAFSQADACKAFALAASAHDDGVAVLEEAARFAGCERDRPPAPGRDFEQAAEAVFSGRRDRTGPEQIARSQVAAPAAVMAHELCDGPVQVARAAYRQALWGKPFRLQTRCEQIYLELDVEGARGLVRFVEEIRQRSWIPPQAASPAPSGTAPVPRE
jgi:hypothetical protein